MTTVEQGDVLNVEKISVPLLVVSKNFFNQQEEAFVCPVVKETSIDPLHIRLSQTSEDGSVLCEQLHMLDLHVRCYKKIGHITCEKVIDITDAIQSIFDHV